MTTTIDGPGAGTLKRIAALGDWLIILAFAGVISAPLLLGFDEGDPEEVQRLELRQLTRAPQKPTTMAEVLAFPTAFEAWFNDAFGGRRWLVENQMKLHGEILHLSPSPLVVMGEDGWLYYTKSGVFADYRGELRLSDAELRQWQTGLEARQAYLQSRGIPFVFAFAPNKVTVHPEHLPPRMRDLPPQRTRLDQLVEHLEATSQFRVVDMRPRLRGQNRSTTRPTRTGTRSVPWRVTRCSWMRSRSRA